MADEKDNKTSFSIPAPAAQPDSLQISLHPDQPQEPGISGKAPGPAAEAAITGQTPAENAAPPAGTPPPQQQMPQMMTGMLRQDIELIRPGEHGDFAMLFDPAADAYYKISKRSLEIISRIDKNYSLHDFLNLLNNCGMQVTKDEALQLIAFLHQNNLIAPEYGQMEKKYAQYVKMKEETLFLRFSSAYLFFKLPPIRPEKFYNFIRPAVSWMASKFFVLLLLIPAVAGYILMLRDFPTVRATFLDSLSWAGLAKYFVAILVMKVVHEAAHSLAAIHFNCRVRGIGLGFMVFYPRLFTDTTDSWRLPRQQRLLIDAAGIIIELLVGGIAALIWVYSPPGMWKSTMFYIFAVSTISTLFVNGNPCIRYDGYYILCDITNMENLMTRSAEYVKQFWRWYFLRLGASPKEERGGFLLFFGIISFIYRIFLYTSIIIIIYNQFVKAVALVALVLELYAIFIYPMYKEIKTIRALSKKSANWARLYLFFFLSIIIYAVLFFPFAWNVDLAGEVVPVSQAQVTVMEGGYLTHDLPGKPLDYRKNQDIFTLESPFLDFGIERSERDISYLEMLHSLQLLDLETLGDAKTTKQKISTQKESLLELQRRKKDLHEKAPVAGIYIPRTHGPVYQGMFLPKGTLVGEIATRGKMAYAYADDRDIPKLKIGKRVRMHTKDSLRDYYGTITAIDPVPAKLRNSPLLQQYGGPLPVYIDEKNPGEYTSVLPLYRIEIQFEEEDPSIQLGRTIQVEVIHTERLYDSLKQYILSFIRKEF